MGFSSNIEKMTCEFCGKSLEHVEVSFAGSATTIGYKPCDCEQARADLDACQERERLEEAEKDLERRQRRLAMAGIPPRYWDPENELSDDDFAGLVDDAKTYGLWIQGPVGTGKTNLACAIGIELLDQGLSVLFVKASDLVDMMSRFSDNLEAVKTIQDPAVLIIDDIGMEETRDWSDRRLRRAIDARWDSGKPTIATSNFTKEQIALSKAANDAVNAKAIVSRLAGMTKTVNVGGPDRRVL